MTILRAKEKDLKLWSSAHARARYDYDADEYLLDEMLNDEFFGGCHAILKNGDYITITDAEDQVIIVRVDFIDKKALTVGLSKMERLHALPVVKPREDVVNDPGLAHRWRTSRGGGHSIITAKGELVGIQYASKDDAERAIAIMYENAKFIPAPAHMPTRQFAKNIKIFDFDTE